MRARVNRTPRALKVRHVHKMWMGARGWSFAATGGTIAAALG